MKKIFPMLGAAALALTLSACGGGQDAANTDQGGTSSKSDTSQDLKQSEGVVGGDLDAALTAIRTAEAEVDGGKASEIDFENEENEWEVTVLTESQSIEIHIQDDGSSVVKTDDPESPETDDWQRLGEAQVDFGTALKSAIADTAGTIDEANIDDHKSGTVWEIDIYPEGTTESVQLLVDAESGDIMQGG
ncbi:MAG: PepSY domain-containing protein [Canibacter sp.]